LTATGDHFTRGNRRQWGGIVVRFRGGKLHACLHRETQNAVMISFGSVFDTIAVGVIAIDRNAIKRGAENAAETVRCSHRFAARVSVPSKANGLGLNL